MATETLRPNGAGIIGTIPDEYPDAEAHYTLVDEETADEDATYVACSWKGGYARDVYTLPAHGGSGTINKVTVYCRGRCTDTPTRDSLRVNIVTHGTEYYEAKTVTTGYANYSKEWTTNPNTGLAWTWDEIDALEAGVGVRSGSADYYWATRCTQVYVEVDYTPGVTEKTSSDAGSGVEGAPMQAALLAGTESGSGIEALLARLLAAFDIGTSNEAGGLQYDKDLLATELGQGSDSLTIKIEMPTKGGGMKLWT